MMNWLCYVIDKLWPAFVTIPLAVLVTQVAAQKLIEVRKPRLEIIPEGIVHTGSWGSPDGRGDRQSFHAWRIRVQHIPISKMLTWLIKGREPALHCKTVLTFYDSMGDKKFIMHGRWANTPEPSLVSNTQERIIYPDTIDIGYHDDEPTILDCIHKFDDEKTAYAWNNQSYAYNGKPPTHTLEPGTYRVEVELSGPNVRAVTTKFDIKIEEDWQRIAVTPAGDHS